MPTCVGESLNGSRRDVVFVQMVFLGLMLIIVMFFNCYRQFRSLTLTVTFKKPFDLLAQTTVAANLAASENERNSI